ncbi:MAG: autotransporter-associated beta strand repeat-containing protein, partial [Verrucomicrobiota bacterium]
MSPSSIFRLVRSGSISVLVASAISVAPAPAATLYWDTNGATTSPIFGAATGTWGVDSFWTTSSNGAFADNRIATTNTDTLIVSPNAVSTLTVSGAVACDSIDLTNSGGNPLLTVSGGTSITLGTGSSATAGIKTSGDGSAVVSTPIILGSSATFLNNGNNGGGSLTISGGITGTSALSLLGIKPFTISTVALNNAGKVTNTNSNTTTISANIGAAVTGVTQNGTSTLILSGTNSGFLGTFTVTKGTLQFNSALAFSGGAGGTVNVSSGGAVVLNGATDISSLAGRIVTSSTGAIALNVSSSAAIDFNAAGFSAASLGASGSVTYSGTLTPTGSTYRLGGAVGTLTVSSATLTGSNSLTVVGTPAGTSTVVLSGANTYTGTTTLTSGYLNVGITENENVSGPLGKQLKTATGTIILNGGTLQYSAANQYDYSGRFSSAAAQQYMVDTNNQTVTWAANLTSSSGSLTLN